MSSIHAHWSHYDVNLEQADFDAAHVALLNGEDLTSHAESLREKAQSYGYGEADGFLSLFGAQDPSDDTEEQSAARQSYEAYQDGDYWQCIDRSERLMMDVASTPERVEASRRLTQDMRDAFEEGRRMRTEAGQTATFGT